MLQLLSLHAAATEARTPIACAPQEEQLQWEAHAPHPERRPCSQLEKALVQPWLPSVVKNKWMIFKKKKDWKCFSSLKHNSCCSSVAQLCPTLCDPMDCSTPGFPVLHRLPVFSNSCPLSWWCHPTISSSVVPFSSRLQSFPASQCFLMSWLFMSGGQSTGASASASSFQWIFRVDFL